MHLYSTPQYLSFYVSHEYIEEILIFTHKRGWGWTLVPQKTQMCRKCFWLSIDSSYIPQKLSKKLGLGGSQRGWSQTYYTWPSICIVLLCHLSIIFYIHANYFLCPFPHLVCPYMTLSMELSVKTSKKTLKENMEENQYTVTPLVSEVMDTPTDASFLMPSKRPLLPIISEAMDMPTFKKKRTLYMANCFYFVIEC